MLAGTVAAAALATVGAPVAAAVPMSGDSDEDLLLRIAGAIAVMPVPFPGFDERGPAIERATRNRLRLVLARMNHADRGTLFDGLDRVRRVMSVRDDDEMVVRALGRAATGADSIAAITIVVSTGIATISSRFEPGQRPAAELWLDYARRFAALPSAVKESGLR
ncbi:hypothetical protein AMK34_31335 [Amycolatopsis sp. CB00013]|nr:hypothetical protein AMK34_31335 [Amycolatopsis sp. CB00013]